MIPMTLDPSKAIERLVDSIARIYAIVIGVALSESIKTLITKNSHGDPDLSAAQVLIGLPAFVAFVFTLVPFWHGMNRHLDRTYLEKDRPVKQGALLIDFGIFFLEAILLFVAGSALRTGLVTFYLLGVVLLIDILWGFVAHEIHSPGKKSHVRKWATINAIAGAAAFFVVLYQFDHKPLALMAVAVLRSGVDYWLCWEFYFPSAEIQPGV